MTDDPTRPAPRTQAGWAVRSAIRAIARDVFGATFTETPIEGFALLTRPGLDDPLAGVRAALLARDVADGQIREYAETARGAGRTWAEIGAVLGIDPDRHDGSPGELAFALIVEHRPLPAVEPVGLWREPSTRWTCTTCGQRVTDHGPYSAHPDDNEDGHAVDCPRHLAAIAAWQTGWADDPDPWADDRDPDGPDDDPDGPEPGSPA